MQVKFVCARKWINSVPFRYSFQNSNAYDFSICIHFSYVEENSENDSHYMRVNMEPSNGIRLRTYEPFYIIDNALLFVVSENGF